MCLTEYNEEEVLKGIREELETEYKKTISVQQEKIDELIQEIVELKKRLAEEKDK